MYLLSFIVTIIKVTNKSRPILSLNIDLKITKPLVWLTIHFMSFSSYLQKVPINKITNSLSNQLYNFIRKIFGYYSQNLILYKWYETPISFCQFVNLIKSSLLFLFLILIYSLLSIYNFSCYSFYLKWLP